MGIKKILFRNIKDEYVIFKNKIFEYEYSHGVNKIFSEKDGLISDFIKNEKLDFYMNFLLGVNFPTYFPLYSAFSFKGIMFGWKFSFRAFR